MNFTPRIFRLFFNGILKHSHNQVKWYVYGFHIIRLPVKPAMTRLLILILTPILLPQLQQLLKQDHPVFFHLAGVEEFFVVLEPVAVLEALFGVVAGGVAVVGFDEGFHFLVFL